MTGLSKSVEAATSQSQAGDMKDSGRFRLPQRSAVIVKLLAAIFCFSLNLAADEFSEAEKSYWFFQPVSQPEIPRVRDKEWLRNPIDAFILNTLESANLSPTLEADRRSLIRRVTLDLHGLPPTPNQVDQFVNDPAPDAYEKLIDRLLDSPRYGERYARHWLDLVRYADSDGFKADVLRPNAWRYRDYVIESFNGDKSYTRFIKEQIAGDELYPGSDDAKKATGYLRLWPYEDNQPDMSRHWEATLDDIADVTGDVFLGLSMKCARCHNHKFDAITQKDYYQFRAFFAAISPWEDIYLGGDATLNNYQKEVASWKSMTTDIRGEMDEIKKVPWEHQWDLAMGKLPPYMQEIMTQKERTPYEEQLARFGTKMLTWRSNKSYEADIKGEDKKRWIELKKQLASFDANKPKELERVSAVRDVGGEAPLSYIEGKKDKEAILPGYLSVLEPGNAEIKPIENYAETTGRRATLAEWMTDPENPLTGRVMANRLWQWHFGTGIVASSNDFGILGDRPSHPELLDWLAGKFVEQDWSMKAMHRLIMTSATYRQGSVREISEKAQVKDPSNKLLWKMPVRRMDAEQVRDSMLLVTGEIDTLMGGPAVSEETSARRSIYVLNKRNKQSTMMNSFDTPDLHNSCYRRDVTTTPIQALALINGEWALTRAEKFAQQLEGHVADGIAAQITAGFQMALGRVPEKEELVEAEAFIDLSTEDPKKLKEAWVDFCHVLINTNEFIYIN